MLSCEFSLREAPLNQFVHMKNMKTLFTLLLSSLVLGQTAVAQNVGSSKQPWPRPLPARIRDGANNDILVMTLGTVNPSIADGTFDPANDEMRLKDGTTIKNY